jgi:hypothetical protein
MKYLYNFGLCNFLVTHGIYTREMPSPQAELARRVLQTLAEGKPVPTHEAFQLRNWASNPQEALLSLEEIAWRILSREGTKNGNA